jgi:8-oxo-dGTP pyrophosphatase MutT (NUDIX family)
LEVGTSMAVPLDVPVNPSAGVPSWLDRFREAAPAMTVPAFLTAPDGARPAAVLILFGEGPGGPDLLLIQRAAHLNKHAGQPAFPGGGLEPGDEGVIGAALRETQEETGVDPAEVEVLAVLPELYLARSGYRVTPVAGWWSDPGAEFVVDPGEVASCVRVSIAELTDPANRLNVRHPRAGYAGPGFTVGGMLVWGFTAMLLDQLLEIGGWAVPWDVDRIEDLPPDVLDLAARG